MSEQSTEEARPYWEPRIVTREDLDPLDADAIDLAIQIVLDENGDDASTARATLTEGDWWMGGNQAVYVLQCEHLHLEPWLSPPCWIDEDEIDAIIARGPRLNNFEYGGARLLKKMIAANVSKFHPAPLDAIAAADRRKKR